MSNWENSPVRLPNAEVREKVGKYAVRAAPISALAARNCASADMMSGRRSTSAEGKPAGTSSVAICSPSAPVGSNPTGTGCPTNTRSALVFCATCMR
ncbi:hypothetical protein D3C73_1305070 [compost metagenome]